MSNNFLKIWAFLGVILIAAYAMAMRTEMGETFFLILNAINVSLFLGAILFRKKIEVSIKSLIHVYDGMIETTKTVTIESIYYREIEFGLFFVITAVIAGIYFVLLSILDVKSYYSLIREDGLVEYASAAFWILAAISLFIYIVRSDRSRYVYKYQYLPYILILLFFIVSGGEEISWGQRIFNFDTPELLKAINVQDELTLHNIGSTSVFSNAFFLLALIFFLGIPFLRGRNATVKSLIAYYSLPAPNRFVVLTFLVTLCVWIIIGIRFGTLGFHPFSIYAEQYYAQMDDEIFECMAAYSFLGFSVMNSLRSVVIKTL